MSRKTSLGILAALLVAVSFNLRADETEEVTVVPAEDIEWTVPFEGGPIRFGKGFGEVFATAHGTFGRFPGNFTTPAHTHSHSYHAVVLQGVMINPAAGDHGPAKKMGPGSYWHVPGGAEHTTACVSEEPCVFYMHQTTSFDFTPTTVEDQEE